MEHEDSQRCGHLLGAVSEQRLPRPAHEHAVQAAVALQELREGFLEEQDPHLESGGASGSFMQREWCFRAF